MAVVERPVMGELEFKNYLESNRIDILDDFDKGIIHLMNFSGVQRYHSIRRAIRRGHVYLDGTIYPSRSFNNRGNSSKYSDSREVNTRKKNIYGRIKKAQANT